MKSVAQERQQEQDTEEKAIEAADAQAAPLEPPHPLYAMEGASQFTPDIGNTTTTANNKDGKGTSSKKPSPTGSSRSLQAALGNFKRELTADAESLSVSISQTVSHTLQGIDTLGSSALVAGTQGTMSGVGVPQVSRVAPSLGKGSWGLSRYSYAGEDEVQGGMAGMSAPVTPSPKRDEGRTELGSPLRIDTHDLSHGQRQDSGSGGTGTTTETSTAAGSESAGKGTPADTGTRSSSRGKHEPESYCERRVVEGAAQGVKGDRGSRSPTPTLMSIPASAEVSDGDQARGRKRWTGILKDIPSPIVARGWDTTPGSTPMTGTPWSTPGTASPGEKEERDNWSHGGEDRGHQQHHVEEKGAGGR